MWCIMKTLLDILLLLYSIFTTKRQCGRARKLKVDEKQLWPCKRRHSFHEYSSSLNHSHTYLGQQTSFFCFTGCYWSNSSLREKKNSWALAPGKDVLKKTKKRIIVPSSFMDQKNVMGWNRLKIGFACIFQS